MFSLCPPLLGRGEPHPRSGWGGEYPISGLDRGYPIPGPDGRYPIPGLDRGGVPHPRSRWWVPHPGSGQGYSIPGTLSQVQMVVPCPGFRQRYPISGPDGGTPIQDQDGGTPIKDWMGVPGYPPSRTGWGTPPRQETDQHSELLLCGGRYASCVHAGGLSCYPNFLSGYQHVNAVDTQIQVTVHLIFGDKNWNKFLFLLKECFSKQMRKFLIFLML